MTRFSLWTQYIANVLVVGTGIVYFAMMFLMEPTDEWSVVNHPWQPALQQLHILTAPILVFAIGLIWNTHVVLKLRMGSPGKISGLGLVVSFVPMVLSGYALQVSADETWRTVWSWIHLVTSALWVAGYGWHVLTLRSRKKAVQDARMQAARPT